MKWILALALLLVPAIAHSQTNVNANKATLDWTFTQDPTQGVPDGFNVKCGVTQGGPYTKITTVSPTTFTILVKNAMVGTGNNACIVTAENIYGESAPTNEVFFSAGIPPNAPFSLQVTAH